MCVCERERDRETERQRERERERKRERERERERETTASMFNPSTRPPELRLTNSFAVHFAALVARAIQQFGVIDLNKRVKSKVFGEFFVLRSVLIFANMPGFYSSSSVNVVDGWLEKIKRCEHLLESELKQLCDLVPCV